jgi:NIMA-interacting peptidyl-prolyl cis-trans isomerase 1
MDPSAPSFAGSVQPPSAQLQAALQAFGQSVQQSHAIHETLDLQDAETMEMQQGQGLIRSVTMPGVSVQPPSAKLQSMVAALGRQLEQNNVAEAPDIRQKIPSLPYSRGWRGLTYGLWKLKEDRPEIFNARSGNTHACPPNFVEHSEGWYLNQSEGLLWNQSTNKCFGFDEEAGDYYEIHEGENHAEELVVRAAGASAANAPGRKVIIEDLHKVAKSLHHKFSHFDTPSAMFAVLRGDDSYTTVAAKKLHVTLLQQLASYRGSWSEDRLLNAMAGVCGEVNQCAASDNFAISLSLILGRHLFIAASRGMQCIVCTQQSDSSFVAVRSNEDGHIATQGFAIDQNFHGVGFVSYSCPSKTLSDEVAASLLGALTSERRPRAAAVAVVGEARRKDGEEGTQVVAAAMQWKVLSKSAEPALPAAKRHKTEVGSQVRVRHILVRYYGGKAPMSDPVRRKAVERSQEEAEGLLLSVLSELRRVKAHREVNLKFTTHCKAISECTSCLKGGDFAGDLGWIAKQDTVQPAPVLKAAFELELGQVSDIVVSEFGVHLLLRTA